jgi:hypothetical protein
MLMLSIPQFCRFLWYALKIAPRHLAAFYILRSWAQGAIDVEKAQGLFCKCPGGANR